MVAVIMLRTLNHDITTYNQEDLKEEQEEVTGWKLVHGDVFRQPKRSGLLAAMVGSGLQFSGMIITSTALALFGVLNPSYRGGMLSFSVFLFVFMGLAIFLSCFSSFLSLISLCIFQGIWRILQLSSLQDL